MEQTTGTAHLCNPFGLVGICSAWVPGDYNHAPLTNLTPSMLLCEHRRLSTADPATCRSLLGCHSCCCFAPHNPLRPPRSPPTPKSANPPPPPPPANPPSTPAYKPPYRERVGPHLALQSLIHLRASFCLCSKVSADPEIVACFAPALLAC